jgi:hypothetical protein
MSNKESCCVDSIQYVTARRLPFAFFYTAITHSKKLEPLYQGLQVLSFQSIQKAFSSNSCQVAHRCFSACSQAVKKVAGYGGNVFFNNTISEKRFLRFYQTFIPKQDICYAPKACFSACTNSIEKISKIQVEVLAAAEGTFPPHLASVLIAMVVDSSLEALNTNKVYAAAAGIIACTAACAVFSVPVVETVGSYIGYRSVYYAASKALSFLRNRWCQRTGKVKRTVNICCKVMLLLYFRSLSGV